MEEAAFSRLLSQAISWLWAAAATSPHRDKGQMVHPPIPVHVWSGLHPLPLTHIAKPWPAWFGRAVSEWALLLVISRGRKMPWGPP